MASDELSKTVASGVEQFDAGATIESAIARACATLNPPALSEAAHLYVAGEIREALRRRTARIERESAKAPQRPTPPREASRHRRQVRDLIDAWETTLRTQWTAELLAATFALADGRLVTWGQATIDQHQERVVLFEGLATVNIEGASRHRQAIEELESAGVGCLNDLERK